MKNSKFFKFSILGLLPISMSVGVVLTRIENPTKVDAYTAYTEASLPTTINLNDASDTKIRNYYSELNGKGLNGTNLLKALKPILSNGQKYFSYDSTSTKNAIWKAYEIVDRDWVLSPASEISGYNSSTNEITGYEYRASDEFADSKNPYLHALYVDRTMDNPIKAWGNHNQTTGGINQEHIWPKSHGFDAENKGGARGDLMHLWAADGYTNKVHSNYSYGNVDKTQPYDTMVDTVYYSTGNYLGISKRLGSGTVFEPQDCDKGDIARALFYMAARYNNYAGASNGIDSNEPNLVLRDVTSPAMQKGSTSDPFNPGEYGILSDLLEWNRLDPVDDFEIHRNNILFNSFTKNRNPFIDFPQWAEVIWGNNKTGSANPAEDTINGGEQEETEESGSFVKATSIAIGDKVAIASEAGGVELNNISTTSTTYGVGTNYTNTIKGNFVLDVAAGLETSTFALKNGSKYLCWNSGNSLGLSETLNKNSSWKISFDNNGNVRIVPCAGETRILIWNGTASGQRFACYIEANTNSSYKPLQLYKKDMTIAVTGVTLDATEVTIEAGKVIQLTPAITPLKASNKDVVWSSTDNAVATVDNGKITGVKFGTSTITVRTVDGNFTASCVVNVINAPTVESLSITGDFKIAYEVGEEFSQDGMVVMATLSNNDKIDVSNKAEIGTIDTSTSGIKKLYVTYGGKTDCVDISVYSSIFKLDSSLNVENGTAIETPLISNGVTLTLSKGTGSSKPAYYEKGDAVRFYSNNTFTLKSNDRIVSIVLSFASGDGANEISYNSGASGSYSDSFWYGDSHEVTGKIEEKTSNNRRINCIYVTTEPNRHIDYITSTGLVKSTYEVGEELDTTGLEITLHYTDGVTEVLNYLFRVLDFDSTTPGNKNLTLSYTDTYGTTKTTTVPYKISAATLESISLSGNYKREFYYMDELDLSGLVVVASYSNGSSENVSNLVKFTGYNRFKLGEQKVTVSYTEGELTKSDFIMVNVVDHLVSLSIEGNYKNSYKYGEPFSTENMRIIAKYISNKTKEVLSSTVFAGFDSETIGKQVITATYTEDDFTATVNFDITVYDYLLGISLSGSPKTNYEWNEDFSSEGLIVTAQMASGVETANNPFFSGFDSTKSGDQTVVVSYTFDGVTKEASYNVHVAEPKLTRIEVDPNGQTIFDYDQEFAHDDVEVVAYYEDGSSKSINATFTGYVKNQKGDQTITVSYTENGITKTDSYVVSVNPAKLMDISVATNGQTSFKYNEAFDHDQVEVTAHYEDGSHKLVDATFTGYNPSIKGRQTITVSYTDNGVTKTAAYDVVVAEPLLTSIEAESVKTEFDYGETFSFGDGSIKAHYEDGSVYFVNGSVSGYDPFKLGKQTVTISYTENGITKTTTYNVNINNIPVGIAVSGDYKTEFNYGNQYSNTNLKVNYVMADGSTQSIVKKDVLFTGYNPELVGEQVITVSYDGFTTTYNVTVVDVLKSIEINGIYQTEYFIDEELDTTGMIIKAKYASGAIETINTDDVTFSVSGGWEVGTKNVLVAYGNKTASYKITISESPLTELGCFGSLTGTLGLISLVSTLGAGLLLLKKKED